MATFYQKRDIWHISVTHNGRRITRSLKTNNKDIAKQLRPAIESQLLAEVCGITTKKLNMPFKDLSKRYLSVDHQWAKSTYDLKNSYTPDILLVIPFQIIPIPKPFISPILTLVGIGVYRTD